MFSPSLALFWTRNGGDGGDGDHVPKVLPKYWVTIWVFGLDKSYLTVVQNGPTQKLPHGCPKWEGGVKAREWRSQIKIRRNFRFRPVSPGFGFVCPFFARFCPFFAQNGQKMGKNGQIRFCLFLPKFARIRSFLFVVRMCRSLLPGQGCFWTMSKIKTLFYGFPKAKISQKQTFFERQFYTLCAAILHPLWEKDN